MEKGKTLFHGSRFKIKDFIEPRQAGRKNNEDCSKLGVYATDNFDFAVCMSLREGNQPAFSDPKKGLSKIVFMNRRPNIERFSYVYEVPADSFEKLNEEGHFVSNEKVPILKTYVFDVKSLDNYWRLATEEEFNSKREKFGYQKSYDEFFKSKGQEIII